MEFIDLNAQYRASRGAIQRRIQAVLDHGQYVQGPEVAELEERLARYTGARHCLAVGSGSEALAVALQALGIGTGDEVITTPFGGAEVARAVALAGATPVFADIDRATCNLDAAQVDACVTTRTRAIVPVSLYGQPADMDELNAIGLRRGLAVVEDAAQSFGAAYRERKSCNLSTIGCTSFAPNKPLGCYSDGGAVFTSDDALAARMRAIRDGAAGSAANGKAAGPMDTLQCAIVLAKLERFEWEMAERRRVAASYDALFSGRVRLVGRQRDRRSAFAQYTVVLDERERVHAALRAAGIPAVLHDPLVGGVQAAACPAAVEMAGKVLGLPMSPCLDDAGARRAAEAVLHAAGVALPAAEAAAATAV